MTPVVRCLPLRIVSTARRREHWSKSAARTKDQRGLVRMAMTGLLTEARARLRAPGSVCLVRLTRVAPKAANLIDRAENLPVAFKATIDGLVDALCACRCSRCLRGRHAACKSVLCLDDSDERLHVVFDQSVGDEWGARIQIEVRSP